jgi:hypothetical protein
MMKLMSPHVYRRLSHLLLFHLSSGGSQLLHTVHMMKLGSPTSTACLVNSHLIIFFNELRRQSADQSAVALDEMNVSYVYTEQQA